MKEKRVNVSYPKWKVIKWLLGKQDSKMKTIRNRERIKGQNGWHNRGFGTQGVKGGRINGIQTLK